MKVYNPSATNAVVIHDGLPKDLNSQLQPGIREVVVGPLQTVSIRNADAGQSLALESLLASGKLQVTSVNDDDAVPGLMAGKGGGPAFTGIVRTQRVEIATPTFRIMFGTPVVGDEEVDLSIVGYKAGITGGDIFKSADAALDLVGVTTCVAGAAAVSTNLILTFTSASVNSQAGYTVWAPLA